MRVHAQLPEISVIIFLQLSGMSNQRYSAWRLGHIVCLKLDVFDRLTTEEVLSGKTC